ncbi:hypothetical protein HZA97_08850 [Candidatus Woesearchaeota archaeon]|nr:hypothetical protein [Candidatus Woesearchaeota archaeon]
MACHLQYFNLAGYFNSLGYVQEMGFNLSLGEIFGTALESEEKRILEEAIKLSDQNSQNGELTGIVNLIQLVEKLQEKYGHQGEHKHDTESIVNAMCSQPQLINRYHLEGLAKKLSGHQPHVHVHTNTKKQNNKK